MNKELIKQYKAEFDHWLNGGKVISLFRFKGNETYQWSLPSNGKDDCCGPFLTVNDMTEYKAIIICDDYIEFRKAITEGKTVQYRSWEILEFGGEREVWRDINPANISQYAISVLRIKPDEPKFKIGDLVELLYTNNPKLIGVVEKLDISQAFIEWGNGRSWKSFDKLAFWQPKEGEWVCSIKDTDSFEVYKYKSHPNPKPCQPFLGTLPFNLKD